MSGPDLNHGVAAIEHQVLCAICRSGSLAAVKEFAPQLANHRWRVQDHQIVFAALARIRHQTGISLREQLIVETTRMGFPDIDWNDYFSPPGADRFLAERAQSKKSLMALIDELKAESSAL